MKFKFLKPKFILTVILFILAVLFIFFNLGSRELSYWDEYTNYNVVFDTINSDSQLLLKKDNWFYYEKTDTGEFEKLTTNDFLEKPPLWYYLTMFSAQLFGFNVFSVRIISAIAGLCVIVLTYFIGKRYYSRKVGLISVAVLLASRQLFIPHAEIFSTHTLNSADVDSLQMVFILITFICLAEFKKKARRRYLVYASIFAGFGYLTKGVLATIPLGLFLIYELLHLKFKDYKKFILNLLLLTIPVITIILPWHIYMSQNYGSVFVDTYWKYHVVERGKRPLEGHYGEWYFYLKLLFRKDFFFSLEILLLSLFYCVYSLACSVKENGIRIIRRIQYIDYAIYSFSILGLYLVSSSATKLSWYILPFYPFFALMIAKFAEKVKGKGVVGKAIFTILIIAVIVQIAINAVQLLLT